MYKIIRFPYFDTKNGVLTMFQESDGKSFGLPFTVKRVLVTKDMRGEDKRGGHTHHKTNQILVCISGGCTVDLDDGSKKDQVVLDKHNEGLLLYPYVWHVMHSFKPDTILLVLADTLYDEKDYIRNYEDFIQQLPKAIRK